MLFGSDQFEKYQYTIILGLAWAVVMVMPPKVQGFSLDKAVIDLGSDIFDHGQAYVALSRGRTLEGVLLMGLIRASFDKSKSYVHDEYALLADNYCPIS